MLLNGKGKLFQWQLWKETQSSIEVAVQVWKHESIVEWFSFQHKSKNEFCLFEQQRLDEW